MKQTGQALKSARESLGLSLQEVSLSLKISVRVLQAIEEGDEKRMPAKTFLRGFVKSYTQLLKLNENEIMETFYSEFGTTSPLLPTGEPAHKRSELVDISRPKPDLRNPVKAKISEAETSSTEGIAGTPTTVVNQSTDHKDFQPSSTPIVEPSLRPITDNNNTKTAVLTVLGVILVVLILSAKFVIDKYAKEASVPSDPMVDTVAADAPVNAAEAAIENASDVVTTPAQNAANPIDSANTNSSAQTTATVAPVTNAISTTSVALPTTAAATPATTTPNTLNATKSTFQNVTVPEGKPIELIVEASASVEIEYSSKSGKKSTIKLSPDQVHTFKSKDGLKLNISNGGAVNLILNGRDLGVPSENGKPAKLSY